MHWLALRPFPLSTSDPITQTDLDDLPAPFNSLTVGSTFSAEENFYGQRELYSDYKRNVMQSQVQIAVTRSNENDIETNTIVEIGSGSGTATGELLHFIYNNEVTFQSSSGGVIAIDDWRARTGEIGLRGGAIDIPERIAFNGTASDTQYTGDEAYRQFLSNLVHIERTEVGIRGDLLSDIFIARKTSNFINTYTRSDADLMTGPEATDFYTIVPDGATNPLDEIMGSTEIAAFNTTGRASVIILDIDPATGDDMFATLRCAWNALSPFGTLIIDDVSWQNISATDPADRPVRDGLQSFLTSFGSNVSQTADTAGADYFTSDDYVRTYTYGGSSASAPTMVDGQFLALTSTEEPVLEFHNIWPGRGRWIAVLRRDGSNSTDVDIENT